MKHRYTFLLGMVAGAVLGAFMMMVVMAPPTEQVERERKQREAAALRAVAAALEAYSQTLSTNAP